MEKELGAFLIVEKGDPYRWGEILPLAEGKAVLGRTWGDQHADISFESLYVSKLHAQIECTHGLFTVTDLPSSKHGTTVNGQAVEKGVPYPLKHGDRIELATGVVVVVFCSSVVSGETLDLPHGGAGPGLELDEERRQVVVEGRALAVSGKLYELFRLLWLNRGRAVSDQTIKNQVWPERDPDDKGVALVDDEEVTTLVHRLRAHLGRHGGLIRTIRRYGYLLE